MNRTRFIALGVFGTVLVAQLVRPAITNPPVVAEPHWNSPQTREIVRRACFDCHSNETVVPWYAQVAPARWLVASHINEGRGHLNFSDPSSEYEVEEMVKEIRHGAMPTWDYKLLHGAARLTSAEQDSLIAGLVATFGGKGGNDDSASVAAGVAKDDDEEHEGREGHKDDD